jgi:hypothetical protein
MLPDSIKPYPGDFIVFDYDGLRDHLFRIDNVQFDKASPKKFFRVNFAIWKDNAELILGTLKEDGTYSNISGDFVLNYQNIGGQDAAVVSKADADAANQIKLLYDGYVDKFANLFYHEDMDVFTYRTYAAGIVDVLNTNSEPILAGSSVYSVGIENGYTRIKSIKTGTEQIFGTAVSDIAPNEFGTVYTTSTIPTNIWSPYLQKFIYNNKLLSKYKKEIMVEFYINDIDERSNPEIFSDQAYRNSIYRKLETQNNNLTFENTFVGVSNYDLRQTRNLPFFHNTESFRTLSLYNENPNFYLDAVNFINQDYNETLISLDNKYKIIFTTNEAFEVLADNIETNKIFYKMKNELEPIGIYYKGPSDNDPNTFDSYSISINDYSLPDPLLKIILSYLNGTLNFTSKNILYKYIPQVDKNNNPAPPKWVEKTYYSTKPLNPINGDLVLNNKEFLEFVRLPNQPGTWNDIGLFNLRTETPTPETSNIGNYYFKRSLLSELNNINITSSLRDYMLVPMLLFVLKQTVKDAGV